MAFAQRPSVYHKESDRSHGEPVYSHQWHANRKMRPWTILRKRKIFLALLFFGLVYLFVKNIPTDVPSVAQRIDVRTGQSQGRPVAFGNNPQKITKNGNTHTSQQLYEGPAKFYKLSSSLRARPYVREDVRHNVLFLLYDLRSAASLITLACDMASHNNTVVHIALMSVHDNSIDEVMAISGVHQDDCPVFWHDARPDYNSHSSTARRVIALRAAIDYMYAAFKFTVAIMDEQQALDQAFEAVVQAKLDEKRVPLVVVPNNALSSMNWITSLGGTALALLGHFQIDILITPYKQSAGSLIRLLESIRQGNYAGLPLPRITVELPHNIDKITLRYLEDFRWPSDSPDAQSKLILHRRLSTDNLSPAIASLRTIESFYPPTHSMSHVLVLEPDVEVSPGYLQYLTYLALEYKYGGSNQQLTESLMGISLDLPDESLDAKDPFTKSQTAKIEPLFLSQSPSSTATLYFGEKWRELQDYLSLRLKYDPELAKSVHSASHVSEKHHAWLRQAAELMQVRNHYMLYPAFVHDSHSRLVTVHSELHQDPEEFWKEPEQEPVDLSSSLLASSENEILIANEAPEHARANIKHEQSPHSDSLAFLQILRANGGLPPAEALLRFSANGEITDDVESLAAAEAFADQVSLELSPCQSLSERNNEASGGLNYLFCDYSRR